jgi:hypothetical protein
MHSLALFFLLFAAPTFAQDPPPEAEASSRTKVEQSSPAAIENAARSPETASPSAKTVSAQRWAGARWFGYGFAAMIVLPVAVGSQPCTGDALGCGIVMVGSLAVGAAIGVPIAVLGGASAVRAEGQKQGVHGDSWRARGGALVGGGLGLVTGGFIGGVGTGLAACGIFGNCDEAEGATAIGGLLGAAIAGAIGTGYGATWANNTVRRAPAAKQASGRVVPSVLLGFR